MPVNKNIGKLWFDTKEEIDQYDDLMVSNIELKESDTESENFTIISLREKKEVIPRLSDKAKTEINNYVKFMLTSTPKTKGSLDSFYEFPFLKETLSTIGGYLLIRELPIRNFYARSFLMAFYLLRLRTYWGVGGTTIYSRMVFQNDPTYRSDY